MSNYKETKIGSLPSDWKIVELDEVADVELSNVNKKMSEAENRVLLCNYMDVFENDYIDDNIEFMVNSASDREVKKYALKKGDVLITKDSETREDIAKSAIVIENIKDLVCGYHLAILRSVNHSLDSHFLSLCFNNTSIHRYLMVHTNGTTRFGLRKKSICNLPIPLPSMQEQQKIVSIISKCDKVIKYLENLIPIKQRYKKGLMQRLLSGDVRFPEFEGEEWVEASLGEYFEAFSVKNDEDENLPIMSCSKVHGITRQENIFDHRVASKDITNYKVITRNDLVYDPMLLWDASIGFVKEVERGVISPAYYTFKFKSDSGYRPYFEFLLNTHYMKYNYKAISQGTNRRRRKAPKEAFLNIKFQIPSDIKEQRKIANVLLCTEKEIELLEKLYDTYKSQKKGLMQQLLTGKVRVK